MQPMMTRTVAPAVEPISLSELKTHLRISHTAADAYLETLIDAVIEECDGPAGYLRRALVAQTWTAKYRDFPRFTHLAQLAPAAPISRQWTGRLAQYGRPGNVLWLLPLPPLQSVTSITYFDQDNVEQTFAADNYTVHTPQESAGGIELLETSYYPSTYDRADAVTVTFVAGYGNAAAVPARIRHGLKLLAASLYANRGDMVTDRGIDPMLLDRMLGPYRWIEVQ